MEKTELHFLFGHLHGVTRLTLIANGKHIPLVRHTKQCIDLLRQIADVAADETTCTRARAAADAMQRGVVAASGVAS